MVKKKRILISLFCLLLISVIFIGVKTLSPSETSLNKGLIVIVREKNMDYQVPNVLRRDSSVVGGSTLISGEQVLRDGGGNIIASAMTPKPLIMRGEFNG